MKKIAVIGLEKNNVWDFFKKISHLGKKYDVDFIPFIYTQNDRKYYDTLQDEKSDPREFFCAISVGGDGTFLYTSRVFAGTDIPVFGVNKGHLGFNTNIEETEFESYFKDFMEGKSEFDYKFLMDVSIEGEKGKYLVLNEGVISYSGISRTIKLRVEIKNNKIINNYRGDGLIISTPTGSTGYNLSSQGPILHPSVNAFVLCPICPLTLALRPYILPSDEIIYIHVEESSSQPQMTLDGQKIIMLKTGQKIIFKKSEKNVKIIKGSKTFSEILEKKLHWMG